MRRIFAIILLFSLGFPVIEKSSSAGVFLDIKRKESAPRGSQNVKTEMERRLGKIFSPQTVRDICPVVKEMIREGASTKDVVKTAILLKEDSCAVMRCSIEGGGPLDQTIMGALEAAATTDVIARCCLDGGARAEDVAKVFEREDLVGLGYTPPPGGLNPITVRFPGTVRGGGLFISPSGF